MKHLVPIIISLLLVACANLSAEKSNNTDNLSLAANDNVALGMAYLKKGDMPQAKQKLLLALQENPHNPFVLEAMAYFLEQTGNVRSAADYYQQAIKVAPQQGVVLNNYGVFLCRHGNAQRAINIFMQAVNDPDYVNSAEAYENAGLCAFSIHHTAAAAKFFRQALLQDPHRQISHQMLGLLNERN